MPHVLYEVAVPETTDINSTSEWQRHVITLPEGGFRLRFIFTMGHPFESAAGLDSVQLVPCLEMDDVIQGLPLPGNGNHGTDTGSVRNYNGHSFSVCVLAAVKKIYSTSKWLSVSHTKLVIDLWILLITYPHKAGQYSAKTRTVFLSIICCLCWFVCLFVCLLVGY